MVTSINNHQLVGFDDTSQQQQSSMMHHSPLSMSLKHIYTTSKDPINTVSIPNSSSIRSKSNLGFCVARNMLKEIQSSSSETSCCDLHSSNNKEDYCFQNQTTQSLFCIPLSEVTSSSTTSFCSSSDDCFSSLSMDCIHPLSPPHSPLIRFGLLDGRSFYYSDGGGGERERIVSTGHSHYEKEVIESSSNPILLWILNFLHWGVSEFDHVVEGGGVSLSSLPYLYILIFKFTEFIWRVFLLFGEISLSIALFNVLPISIFDGGIACVHFSKILFSDFRIGKGKEKNPIQLKKTRSENGLMGLSSIDHHQEEPEEAQKRKLVVSDYYHQQRSQWNLVDQIQKPEFGDGDIEEGFGKRGGRSMKNERRNSKYVKKMSQYPFFSTTPSPSSSSSEILSSPPQIILKQLNRKDCNLNRLCCPNPSNMIQQQPLLHEMIPTIVGYTCTFCLIVNVLYPIFVTIERAFLIQS